MSNIIDKIQLSGVTYDIGGQGGSGVSVVEVTQAEYNALPSSAKTDTSKMYVITDAQAGDLTNYYTKAETNSAITEAVSGKVDSDVYTAYTAATDAALANKQTTLTAGTGIDITDNVISATGGGGISSAECQTMIDNSISGKADSDDVYTTGQTSGATELATAFAATQPKLSAGTGISIDANNVISATGGGGGGMTEDDELLLSTALTDLNDRKIDVSEVKSNYQRKGDYVTTSTLNTRLAEYETALDEQNVEEVTAYALNDLNDRFGGLKIVKITESEYAALATKDENTLYIVVADPS